MMRIGLNLEDTVEVDRINVRGFRRIAIKATADDATAGVVEIRRAYGAGPVVAYAVPKTVALDGSAVLIITVDDCPELAVVVTTVGVGTFDIEYSVDDPAFDSLETVEVDLSYPGGVWSSEALAEFDRRATIVVVPDGTAGSAAMEVQESVDLLGQPVTKSGVSISVDGSATTFNLEAVSSFGLYCTAGVAGLGASVWVYLSATSVFPESVVQVMPGADGEYLRRLGDGYESTGLIASEDGTILAPGITFDSDPDNGLYRVGADEWSIVVGGHDVVKLSTQVGGMFSVLDFDADIVAIAGAISWAVTTGEATIINTTAGSGAKVSLREGTTNGSSKVQIVAPDSLAATYLIELFDAQPSSGDGIFFGPSGKMESSPFAGATAIVFETGSAFSTTSNGGFSWSLGARAGGDGFGAEIPFDFEIVGISMSLKGVPGSSTTIEVYKGVRGAASSATGTSVTLSTSARGATNLPASPVQGSADEYLTFKTTAGSGGTGARGVIWVRPR